MIESFTANFYCLQPGEAVNDQLTQCGTDQIAAVCCAWLQETHFRYFGRADDNLSGATIATALEILEIPSPAVTTDPGFGSSHHSVDFQQSKPSRSVQQWLEENPSHLAFRERFIECLRKWTSMLAATRLPAAHNTVNILIVAPWANAAVIDPVVLGDLDQAGLVKYVLTASLGNYLETSMESASIIFEGYRY
ncbi:MAG: hypothetical protein Q8Q20_03100 [bacterium]|nr:hypothetical protein [bacterium]